MGEGQTLRHAGGANSGLELNEDGRESSQVRLGHPWGDVDVLGAGDRGSVQLGGEAPYHDELHAVAGEHVDDVHWVKGAQPTGRFRRRLRLCAISLRASATRWRW